MGGVPVYYVIKIFFRNLGKESLAHKASSIAFNLFLALLPALIFMFTLLPYIPVSNLSDLIMGFFQQLMPQNAFLTIHDTLIDILERPRGELLSFSLVAALYFASNGIYGMMETFHSRDKRSFWKRRIIAIAITLSLGTILITGFIFYIVTELTVEYIVTHSFIRDDILKSLIVLMQWGLIYLLVFVATTILFRHGDSRSERWRHIFPGALMTSILIVITSIGFAFYVEQFADHNNHAVAIHQLSHAYYRP